NIDHGLVGMPKGLDQDKPDNRILATAVVLKKDNPESKVELITKDTNLRIKADVYGIEARDYEPDAVSVEELYAGVIEVEVDPGTIDEFYQHKLIQNISEIVFFSNQYVVMKDKSNPNHSA